jgi:hypothetical protein
MTDQPKAERPTEQPGTPLSAICLNCKMPFSDHQASKEPHCPKGHWEWADTVFAAEVYRVAEALASQWKECPKCHQPVSGPHECYNSVLNGEAPAQTAGTDTTHECKQLFLRIKEHDYPWLSWFIDDLQIAVIVDAMEAWAATRLALSSAASSPEPAATMQELVKFIAENADFGPLMPNDIEGIAQLMQKWAAIRAKASATQFPIDKTDDREARQDAKASAEKGESDAS